MERFDDTIFVIFFLQWWFRARNEDARGELKRKKEGLGRFVFETALYPRCKHIIFFTLIVYLDLYLRGTPSSRRGRGRGRETYCSRLQALPSKPPTSIIGPNTLLLPRTITSQHCTRFAYQYESVDWCDWVCGQLGWLGFLLSRLKLEEKQRRKPRKAGGGRVSARR
ncbi:hypothetical protein LX36DRAFT_444552 [Colletotrichum falcatum]|nr:hypothetical protein LX36DRAFT_444552 [Colletotrichum falcatum]